MSENNAPESIDLAGLSEQLESAHEYQFYLEAENRRLTAELESVNEERENLSNSVKVLAEAETKVRNERGALEGRVRELEGEKSQMVDQLQGLERELDEARKVRIGPGYSSLGSPTPRDISPEDLKPGQQVAVKSAHLTGWTSGRVEDLTRDTAHIKLPNGHTVPRSFDVSAFVLLEDTPAGWEKPEKVKIGDTISTVKELEILKPGTVLRDGDSDIWARHGGDFWGSGWSERNWTPGDMVQFSPFAVLYLPEEDA